MFVGKKKFVHVSEFFFSSFFKIILFFYSVCFFYKLCKGGGEEVVFSCWFTTFGRIHDMVGVPLELIAVETPI